MKKVFEFLKVIIESLLIAVIVSFILTKFVIFPAEVCGTSMEPNLHNGEKGFSFYITRNIKLERFDTVVINVEENGNLIVKRIIGLPGETVEYKDCVLYINGEVVDEYFLPEDTITNDFVIELGEDEYCCMGDNRTVSRDSRYYGAFDKEEILTSHLFIYGSTDEVRFVK